jgi:hypothetical protein
MRNQKLKRLATTLMEVMVTSFLLMIVMAAVTDSFRMFSSGGRRAAEQQDYLEALQATDQIRNEIRQACRIVAPIVGQSNQPTLTFERVNPWVSWRLPTIQPDPVGPVPVPVAWDPLDSTYLAQVSYSLTGVPIRLSRTNSSVYTTTISTPLAGDSIQGFSVDHPVAGLMALHVRVEYQGQTLTVNLPVHVECEQ